MHRSLGDPACDLRSNIAAEAQAKIIYERLINLTEGRFCRSRGPAPQRGLADGPCASLEDRAASLCRGSSCEGMREAGVAGTM
ncbi:manganese catalase family protein [Azoarcus indigens]|uniref:manganese catalase family protein n=1 Tax=Azoarcus indigens TaxID=29545 RepID=UPI001B7D1BE3